MPVSVTRRCQHCGHVKPSNEFPVVLVEYDTRTRKKRRTYDAYCASCRAEVTTAQRKADTRDVAPPDR